MKSQHLLMALASSVLLVHCIHAGQQDNLNDDVMLDLPGELQDEFPADNLFDDLRVNQKSLDKHTSQAALIDYGPFDYESYQGTGMINYESYPVIIDHGPYEYDYDPS